MIKNVWRCGFCGNVFDNYHDSIVCVKLCQRDEQEARSLGYLSKRQVLENARESLSSGTDKRA